MYIHKTTLDFLDFGYGSALAALMFVISMVATSGYLRYTRRSSGRDAERTDDDEFQPHESIVWFAALIVVVNGFFPAVWILLTSLKTETELLQVPITYLPLAPTLANYVLAFTAQPILRFMWNSFVVAALSTVLCVFVSRAGRVRADAAAHAASQPHHVAAARGGDVPADLADGAAVQGDARAGAAQHLSRADPALRGAVDAGLHAGDGELLPGHSARPRGGGDDRRLLARRRAVQGRRSRCRRRACSPRRSSRSSTRGTSSCWR